MFKGGYTSAQALANIYKATAGSGDYITLFSYYGYAVMCILLLPFLKEGSIRSIDNIENTKAKIVVYSQVDTHLLRSLQLLIPCINALPSVNRLLLPLHDLAPQTIRVNSPKSWNHRYAKVHLVFSFGLEAN